jgi:hypothetical protein
MRTFTGLCAALVLTAFVCETASAINLSVSRRDMKLATQQLIEKQTISDPVVADDNRILDDQTTSDSAITTATTFLAQPDVARALSITPGSTTADVPAGDITVTGTDILGASLTETFTLIANQSTVSSGTKAFKTVTSIAFPIQDGAGATYDVGVLDVLGLKRCMAQAGHVLFTTLDGAYETTRPTVTADVDEVEKNTVNINGTLTGAKDVEVFFLQNFRCFP